MGDTTIEWTDKVWNPVTGCTKVSAGCKHCYAERLFPRVYGREQLPVLDTEPFSVTRPRVFTDVRCHPERLEQPLHWKKPRHVFVNSMSDLFHEAVPDSFIELVFAAMVNYSWHTFQILTKRPRRMHDFLSELRLKRRIAKAITSGEVVSENWATGPEFNKPDELEKSIVWPDPNIWLGVSVEDQKTADNRIPLLLQTPAVVRFVSYEPALGPVDFDNYLYEKDYGADPERGPDVYPALDWVIAGGESGPHARPSHPYWFRRARDQCQEAGVPFFMKQITERGRKISFGNWPADLKVRQLPDAV